MNRTSLMGWVAKTVTLLAGLALPSMASAGIVSVVAVSYQPLGAGVAPIPTLGGAALVLLAVLLVTMVWRLRGAPWLRDQAALSIGLVGLAAVMGLAGTGLVYAQIANNGGSPPLVMLTQAEGGVAETGNVGTSCFANNSGVDLKITGISALDENYLIDEDGSSRNGFCSEFLPRESDAGLSPSPDAPSANLTEAPVCSASPGTVLEPYAICSVTVLGPVD